VKIKIYKKVILPVVLYGCETSSPPQREGVSEQGAEGNIWTEEGGSSRRLEKTA